MIIKDMALAVIEGLTSEDINLKPEKRIERIYKYAHIAIGSCKNKHEDWKAEMQTDYRDLKKAGII